MVTELSGVTRIFPGGASGGEFPQNIASGGKLQNLLELNQIVNKGHKCYITPKI